jgi:hypothetical protein
MYEDLDIIEERDGYRVRLQQDTDVQEPYNDGAAPTLKVDYKGYGCYEAEAFNKQAEPYLEAFRRLCGNYATISGPPIENFERYLRIFHGSVKFQEHNVGRTDVYGFIAFDTTAWREEVGAPLESVKQEDLLEEVKAWAEGDVYGYVVEKELSYEKKYFDSDGEDAGEESDTEWVEVEDGSCWGFYGRDWAEQAAKEALEAEITHAGISGHYAAVLTPEPAKVEELESESRTAMSFNEWRRDNSGTVADFYAQNLRALEPHVKHIIAAFPQVVPERDIFYNREGTEAIISVAQELDLGHNYVIAVDLEGNTTSSDAVWETGYTA